eukprot:TRINITY_DN94_c0_g2_i3.p1 TRINITY_DN94_c0_g2~~TRINITY_DN94_c0_g2_i3.p1  ORF type:complete len:210 (-),score=51.10 TRINITY_DN94_c0_g2_i3:300-929(-)
MCIRDRLYTLVTVVVALTIIGMPLLQLAHTLAIEFGDRSTETRMSQLLARIVEPRFFHDGSFGFFYFLKEQWPRGQLTALLMTSEFTGERRWERLFANLNFKDRFVAPAVEGVDSNMIVLSQAHNCRDSASLTIETHAVSDQVAGESTEFQVVRIPTLQSTRPVTVECDGWPFEDWELAGDNAIVIRCQAKRAKFVVYTGYTGPTGASP